MSKQEKPQKSGFVIKLTSETVQKLAVEVPQSKENNQSNEAPIEREIANVQCEEIHMKSINRQNDNKVCPNVSTNQKSKSSVDHRDNESKPVDEKSDASWGDYSPYITYEGEKAIYTDPTTQQKYTWSTTNNSWVPTNNGDGVPGRVYSFENDTHVYTDPDGSKCFWDADKKAWLPKIDEDFLAVYQMSYGFVDNTLQTLEKEKEKTLNENKAMQKKTDTSGVKRKNEPQWFEPSEETNTKVYVSNLPSDLTEEEFVNLMQKCGLVERDPHSQQMKIKLYMDKEHNCFKGDALCTYIKIESVDLALKLLDGSDYKGNKIKVERAHFQLKGEYNPALKPKKKKKKELEKIKKMQQKLFDWRPEKFIGERSKHERVVIVKNLFHPTDFDNEVQLILDYQQDLREECTKCGEVRKVVIYDRHPEGVAQITMKEPEQADAVVQLINGRWFGKRQINAEIWDGRTKYRIAETDADISQRIKKWDKYLDQNEEKRSINPDNSKSDNLEKKDEDTIQSVLCDETKKDTSDN
ncbi:unnamed protein product [Diatraea saccharalis]|uniref:17S U2 SnRNP complex component HTATSF1 n=1 Tax=Diatraea saccharalis TaxID=40085 RepID=A0A9N9WFW5_9NEOP|nr:unnamed protein product [Diatraea saccharalis]